MVLSRKRRKPQFAFGQTVLFGFMDSTCLPQFADSFDHFFRVFVISRFSPPKLCTFQYGAGDRILQPPVKD
jgi:hypothetical protein